jgi:hypothetical protein
MTERDEALRATTDDLIADAEQLKRIETTKSALEPDDPRQDALAEDAQALVREMVPKTALQREIVRDGTDVTDAPLSPTTTLRPEPGLEP